MKRILFYLLLVLCIVPSALAQSTRVVTTFGDDLRENSGMAFYGGGVLYLINDGGNTPKLYRFDTVQNNFTTYDIINAPNKDWEDLATDKFGDLYIGDFGNNSNNRKDLRIYKAPNPETIFTNQLAVDTISFTFQNQTAFPPAANALNYDCEAMAWHADSLYLFTKNRTSPYDGWCYMYVLPDKPGSYVAQLRDSIQFTAAAKELGWITAADVRGDSLLLLSSNKVHLGVGFGAKSLSEMTWESFNVGFSQKESVAFGLKSTDIFISDELALGIGNTLYYLDIDNSKLDVDVLTADKFKIHQTSSFLKVTLKKSRPAYIYVYSVMGPEMYAMPFSEGLTILQGDLPAGTYIIQLLVDGESYDFKWAKTE